MIENQVKEIEHLQQLLEEKEKALNFIADKKVTKIQISVFRFLKLKNEIEKTETFIMSGLTRE